MRIIGTIFKILLLIIVLLALFLYFGPRETVDESAAFAPVEIPQDIDHYLISKESKFNDIIDDAQKQVIWASNVNEKTDVAVVYLHGFSATSHELRPVPENVSAALGANLYYTRFAGHGRSGEAMMDGTPERWVQDVIEAIEIGNRLGDKVLVMATSNGGAVLTYLLSNPDYASEIDGVIFTSPAYKLANPLTALLDFPLIRYWGTYVAGERRGFKGENADHEKYWTNEYPTLATLPMATIQRAVRRVDFSKINVPALFFVSDQDIVVDPKWVDKIANNWGDESQIEKRVMTDGDDPYHHVLAGTILSPNQTDETVGIIVKWAIGLK